MVYGVKEILGDSLAAIAEDIELPYAYPVIQMVVQTFTETELTELISQLGHCNGEERRVPHKDGIRKAHQQSILLPYIEPAIEIHRERLRKLEQRDITCYYYSIRSDTRDEQEHDVRMISHAGGHSYKRVPWDPRTGHSSFSAMCPLSIANRLEKKIGRSDSLLSLLMHNVDPDPDYTLPTVNYGVPLNAREFPKTGLLRDFEARLAVAGEEDDHYQRKASIANLKVAAPKAHVTALGGPMPKDMFPTFQLPQPASPPTPKIQDLPRNQNPNGHRPARGKSTRPVFEMPEDESPPESLMVERKEDNK